MKDLYRKCYTKSKAGSKISNRFMTNKDAVYSVQEQTMNVGKKIGNMGIPLMIQTCVYS